MKKKLPIGISDFKKIIDGNYYYIDKSLMIKELLDTGGDVTLLPRPRRFGKTLNLSMLQYFFEGPVEATQKSHHHLFNGLAISQDTQSMKHQGQYPVVYLTFKDIKSDGWEICFKFFVIDRDREFGSRSNTHSRYGSFPSTYCFYILFFIH